eukprot:Gb_40451 [translate_table: standard]
MVDLQSSGGIAPMELRIVFFGCHEALSILSFMDSPCYMENTYISYYHLVDYFAVLKSYTTSAHIHCAYCFLKSLALGACRSKNMRFFQSIFKVQGYPAIRLPKFDKRRFDHNP